MAATLIILFAITSATPKESKWDAIAQVKDMETCQTVAAMLNDYTKDEPNIGFSCKQVKVAKT